MHLWSVTQFQSSALQQQPTHPKRMTGIGKLTRGAFGIKDLLRNPYFSTNVHIELLVDLKNSYISMVLVLEVDQILQNPEK